VVGDRGFELLNAPEVVSVTTIQESTFCSRRNEKTRLTLRAKRVHLNVVGDGRFEPMKAPEGAIYNDELMLNKNLTVKMQKTRNIFRYYGLF